MQYPLYRNLCNCYSVGVNDGIEGFRTRLQQMRELRGMSARSLSIKIGKGEAYIQALESGLRNKKVPSVQTVDAIAEALTTTTRYLVYGKEETAEVTQRARLSKAELLRRIGAYPVIDTTIALEQVVSAGKGHEADIPQGLETIRDIEALPLPTGRQQYVVRVTGDCMVPDIMPGWTVRFDPDQEAHDGDLVVAAQDGERALVKWLDKRATLQYLLPLNGEPILIDEGIEIVGVVTEVMQPPPRRPKRQAAPQVPDGQMELPAD